MLDNRSLLIENELNQAKSLKEEALEELRQTLQIQKNISEEADNIIKEAKENAKKIIEEAKVKSSEIIKRKEDQANQKILALDASAALTPPEATAASSSMPPAVHACHIHRCVNIAVNTVVRAFLVCEGCSHSRAGAPASRPSRIGYAITSVTGLPAIASGRPPRSCTSDAGSIPISM